MTTCTLVDAPSLFDAVVEQRRTLDELICALWDDLRANRAVACPVCGEEMEPEFGVHARAIGGRCSGCASVLR